MKSLLKLSVVVAGIFLSLGTARAQGPDLPDGPGKDIVQQNCAVCHGLDVITVKRRSPDGWSEVLNRMVASGAQLDEAQYGQVLDYLKATLGAPAAPASGSVAGRAPSVPSAALGKGSPAGRGPGSAN